MLRKAAERQRAAEMQEAESLDEQLAKVAAELEAMKTGGAGAPEDAGPDDWKARPLPVVGVMGSGTHSSSDMAVPLGRWLAGQGVHLLTGGGDGVMGAVSRGFVSVAPSSRRGLVVGVVPGISSTKKPRVPRVKFAADTADGAALRSPTSSAGTKGAAPEIGKVVPPKGYPNPWVELCIRTHLHLSGTTGTEPLSRNHINILTSDVIVALPGSAGTCSEVRLALAHGKPVLAYLGDDGVIEGLDCEAEGVMCAQNLVEVGLWVKAELQHLRDEGLLC